MYTMYFHSELLKNLTSHFLYCYCYVIHCFLTLKYSYLNAYTHECWQHYLKTSSFHCYLTFIENTMKLSSNPYFNSSLFIKSVFLLHYIPSYYYVYTVLFLPQFSIFLPFDLSKGENIIFLQRKLVFRMHVRV